ncbi:MAG: arsenic resistance protein [Chloroflexus sp.]|nr:MAG: arsenic resistance protein [Chloroflexus sp.]
MYAALAFVVVRQTSRRGQAIRCAGAWTIVISLQQTIERYQILVYLIAVGAGLATGVLFPHHLSAIEAGLWPLLVLLLYVTFTQVPLAHLPHVFADRRFLIAVVTGNFVIIPLLVWGMIHWLPDDPALRLGVLLVLLVPCTDWFITFTHLGGGDTRYAIAFSPLSLLLQFLCLPLYLWLFLGDQAGILSASPNIIVAATALIGLPLLAAVATEGWVAVNPARQRWIQQLAMFPIPLLGLVLFTIAATQANTVLNSFRVLLPLLLIFVGFLALACLLSYTLAVGLKLPASQGRVLTFSFGTRNSFVVLPIALTLPPGYDLAVVTIVFQSLVELVGMIIFLWFVPQRLFPIPQGQHHINS